MADQREIGEQVLELLAGIDPERPRVDEELAGERLQAYLRALGLPAREVRWLPDLRALRDARVCGDRGYWAKYFARQSRLLDPRSPESDFWQFEPDLDVNQPPSRPRVRRLAELDESVLFLGLSASSYVWSVRWLVPNLHVRAWQLSVGEGPKTLRWAAALVPLAEAAAAGVFATALGQGRHLVAVPRPKMRFDEEGRLHHWDGLPAAEWPNGKGLYFWRGVEMTESAGRDPAAVTPARIAGWANAERRRVAMERIGVEPFMHALGGTVVQQDDYGRLWRTEREIDGQPLVAVEVVNSTPEPDGSHRRYFLRVPPSVRTARRAVAWSFGLTRKAYAPVAES